ncbi:AAA-ATPase [Quillaja saponaria]|uniref:AAA-ATPase n=1 Tax=Quillaja saponaria TaxID=32244 RepID=A0AAD7KZD4_QUISA|nr:AAA-ATPase [Quillaja saponaria]
MATTKGLMSAVASVAASAIVIRSITNDFIPDEVRNYFFFSFYNLSRRFSSQLTIVLEEFQGFAKNEVFEAAEFYLGAIVNTSVQRIKVSKTEEEKDLALAIDRGEEVSDVYQNVQVRWRLVCMQLESSARNHRDLIANLRSEVRSYELTFHKKHKEKVLNLYLPYILERAKAIKEENKALRLRTVDYGRWDSNTAKLNHPMTFKTLAMDAELKKALVDDLDNFVNGKDFYKRIGKAWKRGYLLYGPPGTGKSSLIAAMANHLNYDIYDLDLTAVQNNSELRGLLLGMSNRSILVVEDIDCSIKLQNREEDYKETNNGENKVTLSGLLNFIDGLWSCCGEERVIIFTTNHKDKLDPALLRPGRMDMHMHMSYCNFSAFKQLTLNYLGISEHKLFKQIEGLIEEVQVTPAEVAGELTKTINVKGSLQDLVNYLNNKRIQLEEAKN